MGVQSNDGSAWKPVISETYTHMWEKNYGVEDRSYGIGAVSTDGGAETMVDFYSASAAGNHLLWSSLTLEAGAHTFELRVTGTRRAASSGTGISVDHADVW